MSPNDPGGAVDPYAKKRRVLVVVSLGVFMATLDGSIVNIALPSMSASFRVDATATEAVVTAYLVAIAATLLLFGALGDRIGRRPLYLGGLVLFTAGSGLCAVKITLELLVLFRVVQAIGGALMFSLGPALLTAAYPATERGAALGSVATAVAGGQTAGPVIGGALLSLFGWPAIFLVNLPIGAYVFLVARKTLPHDHESRVSPMPDGRPRPFDRAGALLLPCALLLIMIVFSRGAHWGLSNPLTLGAITGAAALLFAFRAVERRAAAPLVALEAFRNRGFVSANISSILSFTTIGGAFLILPFYLHNVLHYPDYKLALVLLPSPFMIAVVAPYSGRLSDRIGPRLPCTAGLAVATAAAASFALLDERSTEIDVLWRIALFGFGMALFQSPNNSSIMGSLERRLLGLASGMMATMRTLGFAVGVALGASLLAVGYLSVTGGTPLPPGDVLPDPAAFVAAQRFAFHVIAAICAAGILTSLVRNPAAQPARAAPA